MNGMASPLGDCADKLMELYGKVRGIVSDWSVEWRCDPEPMWRKLVELAGGEDGAREVWRCIDLAVEIYKNTPAYLKPFVLAAASQFMDRRDLDTALKSFDCYERMRAWLKEKGIF
jgi:hypothetical protein